MTAPTLAEDVARVREALARLARGTEAARAFERIARALGREVDATKETPTDDRPQR